MEEVRKAVCGQEAIPPDVFARVLTLQIYEAND